MKNYVMFHCFNGRLINRADFGDDESAAIMTANDVVSQCYQRGVHQVAVYEEFGDGDFIFKESFTIEDMEVTA